jgi:hypothetical protein
VDFNFFKKKERDRKCELPVDLVFLRLEIKSRAEQAQCQYPERIIKSAGNTHFMTHFQRTEQDLKLPVFLSYHICIL